MHARRGIGHPRFQCRSSRLIPSEQGDVALNLYDFVVRRPGKLTEKYGLRAYDETILAPMVGNHTAGPKAQPRWLNPNH